MILAILTSLLYLSVTILQAISIKKQSSSPRKLTIPLTLLALVIHSVSISQLIWLSTGVNLSAFNIGSLVSYCFVVILLISSSKRDVDNLFLFLFPAAALWVLLSAVWPSDLTHVNQFDAGILTHILFSLIAYALLLISTVQAALLCYKHTNCANTA